MVQSQVAEEIISYRSYKQFLLMYLLSLYGFIFDHKAAKLLKCIKDFL